MTEILGDGLPTRIDVLDVGAYAEGVPWFEPLSQLGISQAMGYDANPQAAAEAEAALRQGHAFCHMLSAMKPQRHCISRSFAVALLSSNRKKKSLICSRRFQRRRRGAIFGSSVRENLYTASR